MTELTLNHIGGPTLLIEFDGWRILTDPTFDPPGSTYKFGLGTSSKKLAGPAVAPGDVGPLDAILLSHDHHGDNLDPEGRKLLPAAKTVVTTTSGAKRLGGNAQGLGDWGTTTLEAPDRPSIEITAPPCRHGPPLSHPIVGDVVGFSLSWEGQENGAFWVSGDTVLYPGVKEVAGRLEIGTAVMHMGGVRFPISGPLRYTMTAAEAADLAGLIKPSTVIPLHYEGWKHFREGRAAIEKDFASQPSEFRDSVRWLEIGNPTPVRV